MGLMMLAASQGTPLELVTSGEHEEPAMKALLALIADRFGESE
jgi:phosphocarrier protein